MKYIFNFNDTNEFSFANIMHDSYELNHNDVELKESDYFNYINILSEQVSDNIHILLNEIYLDNNEIKVRKLYNKKQITALEKDYKKTEIINNAKSLLVSNEWRWLNPIKYNRYNNQQKQLISTFYDSLIKVINNESLILPDYNLQEELNKLS